MVLLEFERLERFREIEAGLLFTIEVHTVRGSHETQKSRHFTGVTSFLVTDV